MRRIFAAPFLTLRTRKSGFRIKNAHQLRAACGALFGPISSNRPGIKK